LLALAALAGNTVVTAATTDAWEAARHKFARLLGRGDSKREQVAQGRLAETHEQLTTAAGADLEPVRAAQAQRWQDRFADLLEEDPGIEAELRALVEQIRAALLDTVVSAADHAVVAGGNVHISASEGGVAAGVIHGDVSAGNPPGPGPGQREPDPGPR
jgi:hypothetical protein